MNVLAVLSTDLFSGASVALVYRGLYIAAAFTCA
jgi:hypothetical protein